MPIGGEPGPSHQRDHRGKTGSHGRMSPKTQQTKETISAPQRGKERNALNRTRKELASRFYQLLPGHAAVAEHLARVNQAPQDRCWFCSTSEKQTRFHLFVKCRRWEPEIRKLWQRARLDSGWAELHLCAVFGDERNVPAILEFLEETKVGKVPGRILLLEGPDLEGEDPECLSLRVQEEEEETEVSSSEEEDGPGPPL